jgi:glycosyltransferase involved in cell wall biosynthesis
MANAPIPRLSVVITCHNAAQVLGSQLDALLGQTWRHPWEIVIVDNCSTDPLLEVVKRYQRRLPQLRVIIAGARKSQAYALNAGIAQARSTAIALCDADDEVGPGWVQAMGEALLEQDAVAGRVDTQKLNPPWLQATFGQHPQRWGLQTAFIRRISLMQEAGTLGFGGPPTKRSGASMKRYLIYSTPNIVGDSIKPVCASTIVPTRYCISAGDTTCVEFMHNRGTGPNGRCWWLRKHSHGPHVSGGVGVPMFISG